MTVQKKDTNTHIHKNNNNYNDQTIYETENSFGEQKNRVTAAVDVLDELKPRTSRLGGQTLFCFVFFCFLIIILLFCVSRGRWSNVRSTTKSIFVNVILLVVLVFLLKMKWTDKTLCLIFSHDDWWWWRVREKKGGTTHTTKKLPPPPPPLLKKGI